MTTVELHEFGHPIAWPGDAASLDSLRAQAHSWKRRLGLARDPFIVTRSGSRHLVRVIGVAGFISAGSVAVEVRPFFLPENERTWRASLWRILAAVYSVPPLYGHTSGAASEDLNLPDMMGWVLENSVAEALDEGLPRGYSEHEGWLPYLRGRLNVAHLASTAQYPGLVPCIYEEYGENTPLRRLLAWAARFLASSSTSAVLASRLEDAAFQLNHVQHSPPSPLEAERISLPAQHSALQPALTIALLLLKSQSIENSLGGLRTPAFLWNSASVFERYLRILLTEAVDRIGGIQLRKISIDAALPDGAGHGKIGTTPDYTIHGRDGTSIAVLDAKYKRWKARHNSPPTSDYYQVIAGARAADCATAGLIYPSAVPRPTLSWTVRGEGMPRVVKCIFANISNLHTLNGEDRLVDELVTELRREFRIGAANL